jgi:cyclophilin family peptidyl-prolyl cis-trans isomerase
MFYRLLFAVSVVLSLSFSAAAQQVVRFQTTVGDFDMVLNPTNNPVLADYAQNLVNYVQNNNYLGSWINRADKENGQNFVLQMGGFFSNTRLPSPTINSVRGVQTFQPVVGHPAQDLGLSNTIGTVALALPADSNNHTLHDEGTSSFFVNLTSNTFLDPDFTVFAAIPDMTTINNIMALQTVDRTTDPNFGAGSNLSFSNVPVAGDGSLVFIKRAFLVTDALIASKDIAGVKSVVGQSSLAASPLPDGSSAPTSGSATPISAADTALSPTVVPEPTSLGLAFLASVAIGTLRRRR